MQLIPDWLIKTIWWISGLCGAGAWYLQFIHEFLWAMVGAAVGLILPAVAIALQKKRDAQVRGAIPRSKVL